MKLANTVRAHWSGIVHFVESHITNGILKGINSKLSWLSGEPEAIAISIILST
jgi:transposase